MRIYLKAKPGAKKNKVSRIDDSHFRVWVKEMPVRGRANKAVTEALAGYLKVPKSRIKIISGETSRQKIAEIS